MIIWERITNISIKFETVAVSNTKEYWVKPTQIVVPAVQASFVRCSITTGTMSARKYSKMMRKQ